MRVYLTNSSPSPTFTGADGRRRRLRRRPRRQRLARSRRLVPALRRQETRLNRDRFARLPDSPPRSSHHSASGCSTAGPAPLPTAKCSAPTPAASPTSDGTSAKSPGSAFSPLPPTPCPPSAANTSSLVMRPPGPVAGHRRQAQCPCPQPRASPQATPSRRSRFRPAPPLALSPRPAHSVQVPPPVSRVGGRSSRVTAARSPAPLRPPRR